jgi:hypothetical protein
MNTSSRARIASSAAAVAIAGGMLAGVGPQTANAAAEPFLFSYAFNNHLKLGGGQFTVGGRVYVVVKLNNGTVKFAQNVTVQPHAVTLGGAINVEASIAAPCPPGDIGYARAYDRTTQMWSPRLPVAVCVRID